MTERRGVQQVNKTCVSDRADAAVETDAGKSVARPARSYEAQGTGDVVCPCMSSSVQRAGRQGNEGRADGGVAAVPEGLAGTQMEAIDRAGERNNVQRADRDGKGCRSEGRVEAAPARPREIVVGP